METTVILSILAFLFLGTLAYMMYRRLKAKRDVSGTPRLNVSGSAPNRPIQRP